DDLLRAVAMLAIDQGSWNAAATSLSALGEQIVPMIARLAPPALWPSILFVAGSANALLSVGQVAVNWAMRIPALSIAIAVPVGVWDEYVTTCMECRAKALLREGEVMVPAIDVATAEQTLTQAGAVGSAVTAITANGADEALLDSAVDAIRAINT